jgi:hypothetical protein
MNFFDSDHYKLDSWNVRDCYVVDVNQQLRASNALSQLAADRSALLSAVAERRSARGSKARRRFGWRAVAVLTVPDSPAPAGPATSRAAPR